MPLLQKISFALYSLAAVLGLVFALMYLLRSRFMSYHSAAVGLTWDEVDERFRILIIALLRVAGGGYLTASTATIFLLLIPFRHGELWANWALLAIGLASMVPSLAATLLVKFKTPASPPWTAASCGLVLLVAGFILRLLA
jgi:hypothetical protein